jgi:hypothetical protein
MKSPTTRYLLQELLIQLRKLNGDERMKNLEHKIETLTGNQTEDRKRHEALVEHLKVEFIKSEKYEKKPFKKGK